MNAIRNLQEKGRVAPILATFAVSLLLAACSMPEFGRNQATPVAFEATPYQAGASVDGAPTSAPTGATAAATAAAPAPTAAAPTADAPTADASTAPATAVAAAASGGTTAPADDLNSTVNTPAEVGVLSYTAEVVAANRVDIVAEVGGMVLAVNPEVGDRIAAGDVLVELDPATLEAQRAQALAALEAVQAQLELVLDQVEPEAADLEAAQAAVNAAAAAYTRAVEGATEEDRRAALAQLKQAEAAVTVAQAAYNRVKGNPSVGALPESLQLQQATLAVEAAQAQYDKVVNGSTGDIIAGAYAQLASARAQLEQLQRGPEDAQIRALEAQVKQAETALYLSQLQLDKTTITAPVDGIVASLRVSEGAMVAPGTPVLQLLSPENEIVIAVEESRLQDVAVGLPITMRVDAYPDVIFAGEVIRIAPELDPATRTVDVVIRPTDDDARLAPGMFAVVEIGR